MKNRYYLPPACLCFPLVSKAGTTKAHSTQIRLQTEEQAGTERCQGQAQLLRLTLVFATKLVHYLYLIEEKNEGMIQDIYAICEMVQINIKIKINKSGL